MNPAQLKSVIAALLCAGCASPVIKSEPAPEHREGLAYALPKGQVQLDVVRKVMTEDDVKVAGKAVDSAKAALEAADARLKEATEARDLARHEVDALRSDTEAAVREKIECKLGLAEVVLRARTAEVAVAGKQHTDASERLAKAKDNVNKMEQVVTLKALPVIADANHRYVAQLQSNLFRDDSIKLSVSNGLLNTATSESTGQVGNILVSLASAVSGARGAPLRIDRNVDGQALLQQPCKPFAHTWIFDPTDQKEINQVAKEITGMPESLVELKQPRPTLPPASAAAQAAATEGHIGVVGLAYRVPVTVTIEVELKSGNVGCEVSSADSNVRLTATLPDSKTTYSANVNGASFTKTKAEYAFKDGMLVSLNSDQPSQAAAVARLPIEILKAIVEVPASILKLKVDYDSQAEALIKERTDQLKAQVDLINAQKALDDARQE